MFGIDVGDIVLMIPAVLIGFTVHEFSHARVAVWLGDTTPRDQGRLTLNPVSHIDLMGLVLILIAGFGWAKPVQVNPKNFKNPKGDEILVSVAGPFSNIVCAVLAAVLLKVLVTYAEGIFSIERVGEKLYRVLVYVIYINLMLSVLNLIPVPPLDGSHIVLCFVPDRFAGFKAAYMRYGRFFLFAIILLGSFSGGGILPVGFLTDRLFGGLFRMLRM